MKKRKEKSKRFALNLMKSKNYRLRLRRRISTREGLLKLLKVNIENNKNWKTILILKSKCSTEKRWLIAMLVTPLKTKKINSTPLREMFNNK